MTLGRPTDYTEEIADYICSQLIKPRSLLSILSDEGMPSRDTVYKWLKKHPSFTDNYVRARQMQSDAFAEECLTLADEYIEYDSPKMLDALVRQKLMRIEARKWYASKLTPKKYGPKAGEDLEAQIVTPKEDPFIQAVASKVGEVFGDDSSNEE